MKISAVIPAAGVGKRFNSKIKKQFFYLKNRPLLYYTLLSLSKSYPFHEFIIGLSEEDLKIVEPILNELKITNYRFSKSGTERANTVLNALYRATGDYVAVHDAVRPFITKEIVENTIESAIEYGGAICGIYVRDTVKRVKESFITNTEDRNTLFLAHTPQVFERLKLIEAMEASMKKGIILTDEASAYENTGKNVKICLSNTDNIKITEQNDLNIAEYLVKKYFNGEEDV